MECKSWLVHEEWYRDEIVMLSYLFSELNHSILKDVNTIYRSRSGVHIA